MRFFAIAALYMTNFALRIVGVIIYARYKLWTVVSCQLALEAMGTLISLKVAYDDVDVQYALRVGSRMCRVIKNLLTFLCLGMCHLIHLKRAWARQLNEADVLSKFQGRNFLWEGPALGGERSLPVALITGVPFALLGVYAYLTKGKQWCILVNDGSNSPSPSYSWFFGSRDAEATVLAVSSTLMLAAVGLAIVDVDYCISFAVASRYHLDPSRRGQRTGRLQFLFPFVHVVYRMTEVIYRALMLVEMLIFCSVHFGRRGAVFGISLVVLDFLLGAYFLQRNAPREERTNVLLHLVVAVSILLANGTRFIDRPGFRRPAQAVTRLLDSARFLELVALCCAEFVLYKVRYRVPTREAFRVSGLRTSVFICAVAAAIYYLLSATLLRKIRGHDLHSAVAHGDCEMLRRLLDFGSGGEALDPNAQTRDGWQETPLMIASERGDCKAILLLIEAGARVQVRDAADETCFHRAIRNLHIDALQLLAQQKGARQVLQSERDSLIKVARDQEELLPEARYVKLLSLLETPQHRSASTGSNLCNAGPDSGAGPQRNLRSVRAVLCWSRNLRRLFPDAMEGDLPLFHELSSVSALVLVNAGVPLARCLLPQTSSTASSLLSNLRRVRTLGQGACGEVIEVELDEDMVNIPVSNDASSNGMNSRSSFFRSQTSHDTRITSYLRGALSFGTNFGMLRRGDETGRSHMVDCIGPRRFAMKLQAKTQFSSERIACSEVVALRRAQHPFIVRIEQAFQTPMYFVLLLELCNGGDLNMALCGLSSRSTGVDDEDEQRRTYSNEGIALTPQCAARFAGQVLLALLHLHEVAGMIYRDVKPANILLTNREQDMSRTEAKLSDFGLSVYVGRDSPRIRLAPAGTRGFLAPELYLGDDADSYSSEDELFVGRVDPYKTDAYSFGVTLELMLLGLQVGTIMRDSAYSERGYRNSSGINVHDDEESQDPSCGVLLMPDALDDVERANRLRRFCKEEGMLSVEALDLLLSLLAYSPSKRKRLSNPEVRNHPFFLRTLGCDDLSSHLLPRASTLPLTPATSLFPLGPLTSRSEAP